MGFINGVLDEVKGRAPVCLPSQDPAPERRTSALNRARDQYEYDRSYQNILLAKSLPAEEVFSARYIAHVVGLEARFTMSAIDLKVHGVSAAPPASQSPSTGSVLYQWFHDLLRRQ